MKRNRIQLAATCALAFVLMLATVAAAQGAKVDGNWSMAIHGKNGTQTPTLVLTSAGGKLTGTMRVGSDDKPVSGTIDGGKISFTMSPHDNATITFTGTVDGDSMQGTVHMSEADRDWTATRSKP